MGLFKKKEYVPVAIPHDQWISLLKEDAEAKGTTASVLEDDALLTDIVINLNPLLMNKGKGVEYYLLVTTEAGDNHVDCVAQLMRYDGQYGIPEFFFSTKSFKQLLKNEKFEKVNAGKYGLTMGVVKLCENFLDQKWFGLFINACVAEVNVIEGEIELNALKS